MKLSLAWIFDHIAAPLKEQDIQKIVSRFNEVSAEIDGVHHIAYDLDNFFVAKISAFTPTTCTVTIPELNITAQLTARDDANTSKEESTVFLVKKTSNNFDWATHADFGQERPSLVPILSLDTKHQMGSWRELVGTNDVILDVDNKTITHRPDMWGHRGFAREIAAFMDLPFKEQSTMLADLEGMTPANSKPTFSVTVNTKGCSRFTLAHFASIKNRPSDFKMAFRIMRLGMRTFSSIVDITNYVMMDWSQPMHAYDASKIPTQTLVIRDAQPQEIITILDGSQRELSPDDMLVTTQGENLCLGGIKGGLTSGVTATTSNLALESACWDATTIRKTAFKLNLRTDAAARYEKTLSPEQTFEAIARFTKLAQELGMEPQLAGPVIDVRTKPYPPVTITLSHSDIERKMGITLTQSMITEMLQKLGFEVSHKETTYSINVPHWRASKDIAIPDDIIEEIARMYGFNTIPLSLPIRTTPPSCMTNLIHERSLKRTLAQAGLMEQKNYMYYDKRFTDQLHLDTSGCLSIVNPVSDQLSQLANSLIPGLLKNIEDNLLEFDDLSFFEINATWKPDSKGLHFEKQRLAGIFFSRRATVNFFDKKAICARILAQSNVFNVTWKTEHIPTDPWVDQTKFATIWQGNVCVGSMGFVKPEFLRQLTGVLPESSAIIFDLDYELLKNPARHIVAFKPISRYQANYIDVSLLVPATTTYGFITQNLSSLDTAIAEIRLIDSFTKKDWAGKRSLTFRCKILDHQRTMTREDIDAVYKKIVDFAQANNLTIRE